jgi:hypothetical protein
MIVAKDKLPEIKRFQGKILKPYKEVLNKRPRIKSGVTLYYV